MRYCACGCETLVKGTWAPGHNKRAGRLTNPGVIDDMRPEDRQLIGREEPLYGNPIFVGPPPHPQPYDHGKFRIAEEPPGTDMYAPWVQDVCIECRGMLWTHNAKVAEKHESVCETCAYLMFSDLADLRVKNESRAKPFNNPFES